MHFSCFNCLIFLCFSAFGAAAACLSVNLLSSSSYIFQFRGFFMLNRDLQGFNLVLSNDVVDAEGRDREQVGDEATGWKRMKVTPDKEGHDEEVTTMVLRSGRH